MELKLLTHETVIGNEITTSLGSGQYKNFKMVVAFAKNSGIGRLYNDLSSFSNQGGKVEAIVGIDQKVTSYQSLINLKAITKENLYIHHDNGTINFHTKMYLFGNTEIDKVIVGSSNLTAGGLYMNFEANISVNLDSSKSTIRFRNQVENYWKNLSSDENTVKADRKLIDQLFDAGKLYDENEHGSFKTNIGEASGLPFKNRKPPKLPPLSNKITTTTPSSFNSFAMTLSKFDVSSKSQDPVILIPITALRKNPTFWNWPFLYMRSGGGYPQYYAPTDVKINGTQKRKTIRIYYYDTKSEFRLQCEGIKRNGNPNDIMLIKKTPSKSIEYEIELVRSNSSKYKILLPKLTETTPNKRKFYNYF
ncbi:hypothetical protein E3V36_04600 [Candidatus Marinimicrobia bacterium MT.SAG.2]|nr:hypothetical protein E3V36_04600 [Candidatus Marinimicrobia bacterium MT.SAG.2]